MAKCKRRDVAGAEIVFAGYQLPLWPSAVAFVIAGGMSLWMWRLSFRSGK
jgi:nitrate reductase NapE component